MHTPCPNDVYCPPLNVTTPQLLPLLGQAALLVRSRVAVEKFGERLRGLVVGAPEVMGVVARRRARREGRCMVVVVGDGLVSVSGKR